MTNRARDLEVQALELTPEERARLAERLIASLDPETDPRAEELWLGEAERRLSEIESGDLSTVPAEQVIEKARTKLR